MDGWVGGWVDGMKDQSIDRRGGLWAGLFMMPSSAFKLCCVVLRFSHILHTSVRVANEMCLRMCVASMRFEGFFFFGEQFATFGKLSCWVMNE